MQSGNHANISGSTYSKYVWLDNHNAIKSRMRSDVISDLPIYSGDHVLDAGCGVGYWSSLAAARVGVHGQVLGIDSDPESIALAESRCDSSPLRRIINFQCSNLEDFPVASQSFDVVLLFNVLSYVDDPLGCLKHFLPALRRNGRIFIKDTDLQSDFFHPVPVELYCGIVKAALGGPARPIVGNFDPFFARRIAGMLSTLPDLHVVTRSHSFSVFRPVSNEERHFIGANAYMFSTLAEENGAIDLGHAWRKLFDVDSNSSIFESIDFMYSMNEFIFQLSLS
jgi:ubiquinone/menaquinone biosynthesis C-methylase UbiE